GTTQPPGAEAELADGVAGATEGSSVHGRGKLTAVKRYDGMAVETTQGGFTPGRCPGAHAQRTSTCARLNPGAPSLRSGQVCPGVFVHRPLPSLSPFERPRRVILSERAARGAQDDRLDRPGKQRR